MNVPGRSAYGAGRLTAQRRAIASTVERMLGAFTVEDLVEVVRREHPQAGATATVYRAVAAMESARFLQRVGLREGSTLYARCGAESHHHHIVCDGCGRVAHTACPLDHEVADSAAEGFVITRHEVTMYGLCPSCLAKGGGA